MQTFLSTAEFAKAAGLPMHTVRKLLKLGVLQSLPGRRVRIHASEASPERLATLAERANEATLLPGLYRASR